MRQTFDEATDPSFGARHLPLIRAEMTRQGLDGLLIPHEDEHQNEYLPAANDRLAWATGFTGSAGAAIVLADTATVFTDGRYTLQVKAQVDGALFGFADLVEDGGLPGWLGTQPLAGRVIGYDPRLHSPQALGALSAAAARAGARLAAVEPNPLDAAWAKARPEQPAAPVVPHSLAYAGEDSAAKRARVGEGFAATADVALLTSPSSIAWLFNVRGGDVIRSPLPLGQAIVEADGRATLFLEPAKVTPDLRAWLGNQVALERPEALPAALDGLAGRRVLVDPAQSSAWYFERLRTAGATVVEAADPCALPRACKNPVEVEGARRAHRRDGAALSRFLHWLATEAQTALPDEATVVTKLEGFREATGALQDLSFDTIAGAGPNGAIMHYRPTTKTNRRIAPGQLLLVDSGGQYLDGTTDVTRVVPFGEPTAEMRERYTLVLKGHIALARLRFPAGTSGHAIDVVARQAMWAHGLDYEHGTGHGVGSYLGVHEGPQRIAAKAVSLVALQPGMIVSNEPGYYKEGAYGIRIENLQVVTEASDIAGGEKPMLGFEALTLAPFERTLIDVARLSPEEHAWVDAYHARVSAEIGPQLDGDAADWLQRACAPL